MAGLIGLGQNYKQQGIQSLSRVSDLKRQREQTNDRIEQQDKQQTMSAVGTGASIGTMIKPGVGTLVGAGVGYLADSMF